MPGDYTRRTFDPLRDRVGVFQQQGRVTVDADQNELVDLIDRRLRVTVNDIFGDGALDHRCAVVPAETPHGFEVTAGPTGLEIGAGRCYVDGILVDNHGEATSRSFEPITEDLRGQAPIPYHKQPYLTPASPPASASLAYLDVWHRERTWAEEPDQLDPALYGIDTATRRQTVWQVRLLPGIDPVATCATPDSQIAGWSALIAPSPARLTTKTVGVPASTDPCEVPASGGYRGAENRLYRVQVQVGGPIGTAAFIWSRDNASVASPVLAISGSTVTVQTVGRDQVARFTKGDWVEVIDDARELAGQAGELGLIIDVRDAEGEIELFGPLAGTFDLNRSTRVRRWSQKLDKSGAKLPTSGAHPGALVIDGTSVVLEDGVQVTFSLAAGATTFRVGDYWTFAARTADASLEELASAAPHGPHHHYGRLALVTANGQVKEDCRRPWPPAGGEADDCACDACVTPQSHADGTLTIQAAVDQVKVTGGTVCIDVGDYRLTEPVQVDGAESVQIRGKGPATRIHSAPGSRAFDVRGCSALRFQDLAIVGAERGDSALLLAGVAGLAIERCVFSMPFESYLVRGDIDPRLLPTVGLAGEILDLSVEDCAMSGSVVIGVVREEPLRSDLTGDREDLYADLRRARIRGNALLAAHAAVDLMSAVLSLDTQIEANTVVSAGDGIAVLALVAEPAAITVADNLVAAGSVGIECGASGASIVANSVTALDGLRERPDVLWRLFRSLHAGAGGWGDGPRDAQGGGDGADGQGGNGDGDGTIGGVSDDLPPLIEDLPPIPDRGDPPLDLLAAAANAALRASFPEASRSEEVTRSLEARRLLLRAASLAAVSDATALRVSELADDMAELAAVTAFTERHAAFRAGRDAAIASVLARVPDDGFTTLGTSFGHAAILVLTDLRGAELPLVDTRVSDNRVVDVAGPAIAVLADERSARVEGNVVRAARSAGIVAVLQGDGIVSVSHNEVQGITAADGSSILSGIAVTGAEVVRCHANTVMAIDDGDARIISGILALDTGRVVISDNLVEGVGRRSGQGAGVRVLDARGHVDVCDNQIRRGADVSSTWIGIQVGMAPPRERKEPERILVGQGTASAHGNLVEGSGPGGLVQVTAQGHATVNDNRCVCVGGELSSDPAPVVAIDAASGVVDGNYVELWWARGVAIDAQIPAGLCTVIGNVATGRYLLDGSPLGAPWKALNVRATPKT